MGNSTTLRSRGLSLACSLGLLSTLALTACTPERYARRADRDVQRILARQDREVLAGREERALRPEPAEPEVEATETTPLEPAQTLSIGLADALELAIRGNRDYRSRIESLYLTALDLAGTRHRFDPLLTSLLSYVFSDTEFASATHATAGSIGVSQVLPWGGIVSANASTSIQSSDSATSSYSSSIGIQLTQPLLRGAGREVSHESLVQAERDMVYAVRNFELFREDFTIDATNRFYSLVRSGTQIRNQKQNFDKSVFDRRKAEALFNVGRLSELEVLRAKRQELNSENALLAAEEDYAFELESFRIYLGLPEATTLEISSEPPHYVPVDYDVESAVAVALENRLDVLNRREQLEDSARAIRLAENALLPDVTLNLTADLSSPASDSFSDQSLDDSTVTGSLVFGLPVDRVAERNAYRAARIGFDREKRALDEFEESLRAEIRSAIRELERRRISIRITREVITGEEKNKRIAERRFERGEIDNRELVDAEESLLDARNSLIDERVNYEIARLGLLRDLGILFIDERGMWEE